MVAASLLDPRGAWTAKACFLLGVSYLFVPLDIIPDRLPYVGHLDELSAVMLGLVGAWRLSPAPGVRAPGAGGLRGTAVRAARALAGRAAVSVFAGALTAPVLRLMLGRWPDREEGLCFRRGLRASDSALPPLLRAIAHVPAARGLVNRTMLLASAAPGIETMPPNGVSAASPMMGDPMRIWRGPPIGFLHLEKTAGSSLTTFLAGLFHPLQIDPDPNRVIAPDTALLRRRGGHHPDPDRALVWGHYDLATLQGLEPPRFLLTVLREPRARILSLYHYFRANNGDSERRVRLAHELPLLGYLRSGEPDIVNMVDNIYVRRLTGRYLGAGGRDPLRENPDALLAEALRALDGFDFVGLAEDMDGTLALLGRRLGFPPPARAPRVNVLADNEANPFLPFRLVSRAPLTPAVDAELGRLTRLDRLLYERACLRFASEREGRRPGALPLDPVKGRGP